MSKREIWKDVKGYEGLYQVSNLGRLKRLISNRCLKPRILLQNSNVTSGYVRACMSKDGIPKKNTLHRMVAIAFIKNTNPSVKNQINHIDGNKRNNRADNLEWCSSKENVRHYIAIGLRSKNPPFAAKLQDTGTGEIYPSMRAACEAKGYNLCACYSFFGHKRGTVYRGLKRI